MPPNTDPGPCKWVSILLMRWGDNRYYSKSPDNDPHAMLAAQSENVLPPPATGALKYPPLQRGNLHGE